MSTQPKNVHLHETVLAALRQAAERESKSVDEMAEEFVTAGLNMDRKSMLERIFDRGSEIAAANPDSPGPDDVPHVIRQMRRERTARTR